ncbi:MAG: diaminopimelate epimerase, partial [Schleiferiaceae bacterium]|nr:diaminopimelate epimerase [Schleiferiaceae bacterium]
QGGCNINWVQPIQGDNAYAIRTYERGVESETLSCGTGAVAAALVIHQVNRLPSPIQLEAKGGRLTIDFEGSDAGFKKIQLTGPVVQVYKGQWPW